ncbi:hypothetical protein [Alkalimarinus sediminis]|uniref:Uncharacterized protein n=1 Tax=Alkalimarinus sediminis TaxID=1632866 RepID=A0A9E8KJM4_9ALTE|nr:hypothetical protein [Alkalimarinus sediminis]UZW75201.1 hypothetical protein NNL22_00920 [Alkalimarinus sediminis]
MNQARLMYTRPLTFSIFLAVFIEIINLVLFSFLTGSSEQLVDKTLWTVGVGGIGMGAVLGVFLVFALVDQLEGKQAIIGTIFFSVLILGVVAKLAAIKMETINIAFNLSEWSLAYFLNGVITSAIGGAVLGWLLFTKTGNNLLTRFGF